MRLDKFSNPIFNEHDIFDIFYQGKVACLPELIVDPSEEITKLGDTADIIFQLYSNSLDNVSVADYDAALQSDWFMPEEYKTMDIESWLVTQCPKENYQRLVAELQEYQARNMLDLLRWLKYFVDTCDKENILWGVGRGSSVASYVLFLLGVHSVDSIKYNLDWQEFLR